MHGAFLACEAATNFVQWSLRATSTGSTLMPGFAASNSAIVCFQTGSYWLSVRFAVCLCARIACCAPAPTLHASAATATAINDPMLRFMSVPSLSIQGVGALGARLRPGRVLAQHVETRLDAEPRALRQQEMSILEADRRGRRMVAERALRLHLLEDVEVRDGGAHLNRSRRQ